MTKPQTISEVLELCAAGIGGSAQIDGEWKDGIEVDTALAAIKQIIDEQVIGDDEPNRQLLALRNELRGQQRQSLNTVLGK